MMEKMADKIEGEAEKEFLGGLCDDQGKQQRWGSTTAEGRFLNEKTLTGQHRDFCKNISQPSTIKLGVEPAKLVVSFPLASKRGMLAKQERP